MDVIPLEPTIKRSKRRSSTYNLDRIAECNACHSPNRLNLRPDLTPSLFSYFLRQHRSNVTRIAKLKETRKYMTY